MKLEKLESKEKGELFMKYLEDETLVEPYEDSNLKKKFSILRTFFQDNWEIKDPNFRKNDLPLKSGTIVKYLFNRYQNDEEIIYKLIEIFSYDYYTIASELFELRLFEPFAYVIKEKFRGVNIDGAGFTWNVLRSNEEKYIFFIIDFIDPEKVILNISRILDGKSKMMISFLLDFVINHNKNSQHLLNSVENYMFKNIESFNEVIFNFLNRRKICYEIIANPETNLETAEKCGNNIIFFDKFIERFLYNVKDTNYYFKLVVSLDESLYDPFYDFLSKQYEKLFKWLEEYPGYQGLIGYLFKDYNVIKLIMDVILNLDSSFVPSNWEIVDEINKKILEFNKNEEKVRLEKISSYCKNLDQEIDMNRKTTKISDIIGNKK